MKISDFGHYAASISAAVAMLTGCGGPLQIGAPGALPQSTRGVQADGGGSWVAPEAKSQDLLYISDDIKGTVDIYPYPKGKLVGVLTGFYGSPGGLCGDSAGNVWVESSNPYGQGAITEYPHGGKSPIRRLMDDRNPNGCAVDPTTGNLAVAEYTTLSIYTKAKGKPKTYSQVAAHCGYDAKGDLFVDGGGGSTSFVFAELAKGGSTFKQIKIDRRVTLAGTVQWDGTYVAIGDADAGRIYRTDPTNGKVAKTITLDGGAYVRQFWIQGSTVVGPNAKPNGTVGFWHYPAGGAPTQKITGFRYPVGAVVSLAK